MQPVNTSEKPGDFKTVAGKIAASLFLSIFFIVGSLFMIFMGYSAMRELATYFWTETECTIQSSRIDEESTGGHVKYVSRISYSYDFSGKRHTSDKITSNYSGDKKYSKAQKLTERFRPSTKAKCLVNPSNPDEALLIHNTEMFIMFPFMFIPLIFILVGAGGIYGIWSGKNVMDHVKSAPGVKNTLQNTVPVLFCTAFLLIGLVTFHIFGIRPFMKMIAAEKWSSATCQIISSSVGSHSGDDGATYSVDILYSYNADGREFRSDNYSFMGGSSSGYDGKKIIVDRYPAGSQSTCFINPEDPSDAVLKRGFSAEMLLGLIPLAFVIAGAAGIYFTLKKSKGGAKSEQDNYSKSISDYSSGECVLKPVNGPWGGFLGALLFALSWNGIVSIFVYQDVLSWQRGRPEWFLTVFLIPFVLVGALVLFFTLIAFISLFNPRPRLTVSNSSPRAGSKFTVKWEIGERSAEIFERLEILLECRSGETGGSSSGKSILDKMLVFDTNDWTRITCGSREVELPPDARPSNAGDGALKVHWVISLRGRLKHRPKIALEYPLTVLEKRV